MAQDGLSSQSRGHGGPAKLRLTRWKQQVKSWRSLWRRSATAGHPRAVRISERNASALPPTATSTMKMKKLVAATAEPALFCPLPDALPGAEDPPGVAPGDGVTSPTAGAAVGVGV